MTYPYRYRIGWMFIIASMIMSLYSCRSGKSPLLVKSGGEPYEVLVVCADDVWNSPSGRTLYDVLDADVEGLPQPESQFKISHTAEENQVTRLARNIVKVRIDASLYTETKIRYEKNVYAQPQMIVYIDTPSAAQMQKDMRRLGNTVTALLNRAETNAQMNVLADRHNIKYGRLIRQKFGADILIPSDMRSIKDSRGFVWISDNAPTGMRSICVYSYPMEGGMTKEQMIRKRDSVMRLNIPGEMPSMYMHTVAECTRCTATNEKGRRIYVARGLWEMENDAMGGPFVSHSLADSAHRRVIVAEAFVYAPEMKKRNKIRLLESALYSLRIR